MGMRKFLIKKIAILTIPLVFIFMLAGLTDSDEIQVKNTFPPFAIVELYTSEGCSSCPPADRLLSQIVQNAHRQNLPIYTLSFHVDYWNHLGWTDPFSQRKFSDRQQYYAKINHSTNVYTPQIIINGTHAFNGYRFDLAEDIIKQTLKQAALIQIHLEIQDQSSNQITFRYDVEGNYKEHVLQVALIERGIVSQVKRGENSGRTLRHDNVVRVFKTIPLKTHAGTLRLSLPKMIELSNSSIITYVQNPNTMLIIGAAAIDLSK